MSSDNIGLYEEYLLSENKQEFIEGCKQSEFKQYIRLCHLLNQPEAKLEQTDHDLIDSWRRYGSNGDKRNIVIKDMVNQILQSKDETARKALMSEFNTKFMGILFHDSRQAHGAQTTGLAADGQPQKLKTELTREDLAIMETNAKVREVEETESGLSWSLTELGTNVIKRIDFNKVKNMSTLEQLLTITENYAFSSVPSAHPEHHRRAHQVQATPANQKHFILQLGDPRAVPREAHAAAAGHSRRQGQLDLPRVLLPQGAVQEEVRQRTRRAAPRADCSKTARDPARRALQGEERHHEKQQRHLRSSLRSAALQRLRARGLRRRGAAGVPPQTHLHPPQVHSGLQRSHQQRVDLLERPHPLPSAEHPPARPAHSLRRLPEPHRQLQRPRQGVLAVLRERLPRQPPLSRTRRTWSWSEETSASSDEATTCSSCWRSRTSPN